MTEPNEALRRAREALASPHHTGHHATRQELAELVNAWVYDHTDPPRTIAISANYIGRLESGAIRWPQDPDRRAALRAILNAQTDAELGFQPPHDSEQESEREPATEPNEALRRARQRLASPGYTGHHATRQELADLVNAWVYSHTDPPRTIAVTADDIGRLERGAIRWPRDSDRRAALRAILNAQTDAELGFQPPHDSRRRPGPEPATVDDVDRKEFLRASLGVGVGALAGSSLAQLLAPNPAVAHTVARDHIDEILTARQMFEQWDDVHGGGAARPAIFAQLRHYANLFDARCPDRLRPDLYAAVSRLSNMAGFMSFDAGAHSDAQRLFRFALMCAEESGDWHLRSVTLSNIARQSQWRGDSDAALTDMEQALVRSERLIPRVRAMLHAGQARALAKLGRTQDALAAVGKADEEFAHDDPLNDSSQSSWYTEAEHYSETGHALAELGDERQAGTRLAAAITGYGDAYPRSRAFARVTLATQTMTTGDPHHAVTLATDAIAAAKAIHSQRLAQALRQLHSAAARHQRIPAVAHLRHTLTPRV